MIGIYQKKPVQIDACQWDGENWEEVRAFVGASVQVRGNYELTISTLEGEMVASKGDWIIKGVKGEFYPCKPDIFAATYDYVGDWPREGQAPAPAAPRTVKLHMGGELSLRGDVSEATT